ncbi:hypothetical protein ES332_A06G210800v1 [Gossypium tomentosum]|uniref:Uncharacterized protein n=1 Tax=Gossypium tomentosum TaxID=34277 RepID=A0A5D2Q713_GOSTO|nr:hypothetical protein ES332_A06G210800v1 [Gossypium tomentosum]
MWPDGPNLLSNLGTLGFSAPFSAAKERFQNSHSNHPKRRAFSNRAISVAPISAMTLVLNRAEIGARIKARVLAIILTNTCKRRKKSSRNETNIARNEIEICKKYCIRL